MATVYNVVELAGNGTIRGLSFSSFDREKAEALRDSLIRAGQHNRQYITLSCDVELPAPKPVAQKKAKNG